MISALFQSEVTALESQVAALQAQIAAAQSRIAALGECESETAGAVDALRAAVGKVVSLAPGAVDSLRQTVLDLFNVGCESGVHDDGNQGEQQPVVEDPAIEPEVELVGQSVELCCCLEDAPESALQGQVYELSCFWAPIKEIKLTHKDDTHEEWVAVDSLDTTATVEAVSINKEGDNAEAQDVFQLINLTPSVAYFKRIDDGKIIAAYAGFSSKAKAEQWGKWLTVHHSVGSAFEIRPAKRLPNFRYELKLWGLSLKQIQRLTECDLTKTPPSNFGDASKRRPDVVSFAPKSFQVDSEVAAVMKMEAKLEEAAIEEANASLQPPETPAPPAPAYNMAPIGRRGAASNWKALQAAGGLNLKKHGTGINNGAAAVIEEKETSVLPESQAFKIGDSVVVKSARHGENLLGLTGTIKVANPVGCVVDVASQTRWFCADEIELLTDDFDVDF